MKIGLTYTGSPVKHENYVNWLKDCGVKGGAVKRGEEIAVITLSAAENNLAAMANCDGLVLSGGIDIYPGMYKADTGYPHQPEHWQEERDLFERSALLYALEHDIPVLGVCRGLQLINTTLQGTLIRDLGEELNEIHRNEGLTDKHHRVYAERDSLLYKITGQDSGETNSAHHQAIDKLGEGLRINCHADDGTIEGIEWSDPAGKPFLLGVQWHPERMFIHRMKDAAFYIRIRDRFLSESGK